MQKNRIIIRRNLCAAWLCGLLMLPLGAQAGDTLLILPGLQQQEAPAQPQQPAEGQGGIIFSDSTVDGPAQTPLPAATQVSDAVEAPLPLLVNEEYLVDDTYAPDDLVLMGDYCDSAIVKMKGSKIEGSKLAVDALMVMLSAAVEDGVKNWQVSSGYRSVKYQQEMWDNRVYRYRKEDGMSGSQARAATGRYMAKPGASEHHTGLAFDITVPGQDSFVSTKQCDWLHEHCWDYGFIVRYTAEKQPITGINAEPWHIRYVGLPHSQIMKETGQCLEEYLGKVPEA